MARLPGLSGPLCTLAAVAALVAPALSGCILVPIPDRHGAEALDAGVTLVGVWLGSWPADGNPVIDGFVAETGVRPDLVDVYLDWQTPFANVSHTMSHIASRGAVPILTWEPQGLTTADIVAGTRKVPQRDGHAPTIDQYLASFADGVCGVARQTDQPVLLRFLHEMNGFWFAWGVSWQDKNGNYPNSLDMYKRAWVKVHDAFASRCGDAVRFVWAVNHYSIGKDASFTSAYPGDAYVDYVGIDGYNWGSRAPWGWQGFDTIFRPGYCALVPIGKPILINEVSSTEQGGKKAAWIREMYAKIAQYDRIRGFVWFNDAKYEIQVHGPMDWPIETSDGSKQAFADGARQVIEQRDDDPARGPGPKC
jgi:hypothetical protein